MTLLSQEQKIRINSLFENKKFLELELEIESISDFKNRSSHLANLLGTLKLRKQPITLKDFEDARELFKDAYQKDPNNINAMCNLGNTSLRLRNYENIFEDLKKFIKIKGYNPKVYETAARIFVMTGQIDNALPLYKEMLDRGHLSQNSAAHFLALLNYSSKFSQLEILNFSKNVNNRFRPDNLKDLINYEYEKNPKYLNIGFISPDFVNHSVTKFLYGTLEELKKRNFKIYAFNLRETKELDSTSDSLMEIFDSWHNLSNKSDLDAANIIRKNKINILINLVGYFENNRFKIMKFKPAPIQVAWMGYVNTTGMEEIDYFLTDPNLVKENEENLYSEKIIKLPKIWNCHSEIKPIVEIENLPFLKNNYITFGCFNNSQKVTNEVIETWSKILLKIDNAKILIKGSTSFSDIAHKNIMKKFERFNIDRSRILFFPRDENTSDHYKNYNRIDISLDTFPFPGVTTSIESSWMGVPVLTLRGNNHISRAGESININLGLTDFIAEDKNDYINKALTISKNIEELKDIRKSLRGRALKSTLFDMDSFGKHFSDLLNKVWLNQYSK